MKFASLVECRLLGHTPNKNPPVPRRLVDSSPHQRILPPGDPVPPHPLLGIGLDGEPTKIGVGTQTGFGICGLPIQPITWTGQTDPEPLGVTPSEGVSSPLPSIWQGQGIHVSNRSPYSNGEASPPGQASYEAHSVAPQEKLEDSRLTGIGNSNPKDSTHTSSGGPRRRMSYQANPCTQCVMSFRSLQMPQKKVGVL